MGAIGFCMGGALTLCAAQHAGIDAANPFYGLPGPEICQVGAAGAARDRLMGRQQPEAAGGRWVQCLVWTDLMGRSDGQQGRR